MSDRSQPPRCASASPAYPSDPWAMALLGRMADGDLSPEERNELRALLKAQPDLFQSYVEQAVAHAVLEWRHTLDPSVVEQSTADTSPGAGALAAGVYEVHGELAIRPVDSGAPPPTAHAVGQPPALPSPHAQWQGMWRAVLGSVVGGVAVGAVMLLWLAGPQRDPVVPAVPKHVTVSLFQRGLDANDWIIASRGPRNENFDLPPNNVGDINLYIDGNRLTFADGVILAAPAPDSADTDGYALDNITAPAWATATGNAWVSVMDNQNLSLAQSLLDDNPKTTEQTAGTAVALFPYAGGWIGGTFQHRAGEQPVQRLWGGSLDGVTVGLKSGAAATFTITGLPAAGNLLAVANGNNADNLVSVARRGTSWELAVMDNSGRDDPGEAFTFLYVDRDATGVVSGYVDDARAEAPSITLLNDEIKHATGRENSNGDWELLLEDGKVTPATHALFLTADHTHESSHQAVLMAYGVGIDRPDAFMIRLDDAPRFGVGDNALPDTTRLGTEFRFLAVPFDTAHVAPCSNPGHELESP